VLGLAGLAGLLLLFEIPLCPTATLFGIPCPGCGLTRATLALLSGNLRLAFQLHPLVFVLAPLLVGVAGAAAAGYVRGSSGPGPTWVAGRLATRLAWGLLGLVLAVWIARFFGAFGGPVPVRRALDWPAASGTRR